MVKDTVVIEKTAAVEKIEITIASTVATIEDEIEQVTEPINVVKPNPTKQKAKKKKQNVFPSTPKEKDT